MIKLHKIIILSFVISIFFYNFALSLHSFKRVYVLGPFFNDDLTFEDLDKALDIQIIRMISMDFDKKHFKLNRKMVDGKKIILSLIELKKVFNFSSLRKFNEFITTNFDIYKIKTDSDDDMILFTGYFAPIYKASKIPNEKYRYPIYSVPAKKNFKAKEINDGAILGTEVFGYLESGIDRYIMHLQGSGILVFDDYERIILSPAGSNNYPFKSLSELLLSRENIKRSDLSIEKIKKFFKDNPEKEQYYLNKLDRFIYYREVSEGPRGIKNTLVTKNRSIALDQTVYPYGGIFFARFRAPVFNGNGQQIGTKVVKRFVINQDAGSAIKGPARADLYFGEGEEARLLAERTYNRGELYLLLKK